MSACYQSWVKSAAMLLLASIALAYAGCKPNPRLRANKQVLSINTIKGITYTEVVRYQQNGLSFNEDGYHLNPDWRLRFVSNDSVALFSPVKKTFLNFPLALGFDSVINTNRSFLKMWHMNKDSLVFELLLANNDSLDMGGASVYMKFYADNYITNTLHTTAARLQRYSRRDTLFIKKLVAKANGDIKLAFAAQTPVQLISKRRFIKIRKFITAPDFLLNNYNTSSDYMDPTFNIVINNAYADFYYSFSVYVDQSGRMFYGRPLVLFSEGNYKDRYIKNSTAIMNTYFKLFLNTIPGQTLGMKHTSLISIHVKGIRSQTQSLAANGR